MHTTASPTSEHCNFPQRCIKNAYHSFTNNWTLWKKYIFHTSSTPEIATTLELSCWLYFKNGEICKSIASSMWTLRLQLLFLQVINMELCSNEHCQLELWTCFTTFIKYMIIFMYKNSRTLKSWKLLSQKWQLTYCNLFMIWIYVVHSSLHINIHCICTNIVLEILW